MTRFFAAWALGAVAGTGLGILIVLIARGGCL